MEKVEYGKKGVMILILELERQGFCNLKRALSAIEGL